jgi:arginyl-tRNA synthetase
MNAYETINQALSTLAGEGASFALTSTEDIAHGEYATNIAFPLGKQKGLAPKVCAEELVVPLTEKLADVVEKIEVAGPGFINFFLKDDVMRKENEGVVQAITTKYTGKNILVEHSSPNLFKPFHIGHLMNNIVGEFVTRAVTEGGAHTQVLCFPSDISFGIAKAIYIWKKDKEDGKVPSFDFLLPDHDIEKETELVTYFGECYVRGVALAKEHPELETEMRIIAKNLYGKVAGEDYTLWNNARNVNSVYFSNILESIGSQMGKIIYESDVDAIGKEIVLRNTGEGKVFTESQGAVVYVPSEERKDINTSVFINSEGHATYEAKDIGLLEKKFTEYGLVDFSFFITDQEQANHFKVVLDAAGKFPTIEGLKMGWKERVERSFHIPHGRMLFKGQKMSSRLGGVPLALDVIGVVEEEVRERAGEKIAHLGVEEKAKLEREISLSALRISVLRSKPGININFDPVTSLSFEGDSGPYLLYTHARCASLLEKGKDVTPHFGIHEVIPLEKKLMHFERELVSACEDLAPQKLVTYLFSVAQLFNSYYASTQIIVEGDDVGNAHRLMIVKRVKEVLNRGLHVLGIEAPERM